jgi:hypothetical protein
LDITVVPPLGKLLARWENFPRGVLSGQVVRLNLIIENEGGRAVDHVSLASSLPDVLVFFNAPKADNIVTLQIPPGGIEPGKRVAMTAVFVAPPVAASYSLRTLLYYETAVEPGGEKDKSPRHRVWRMQHDFEVLPGLTLKGFLLPSVCNRDEVVVSLQIAHVNEVRISGRNKVGMRYGTLVPTTYGTLVPTTYGTLVPTTYGTLVPTTYGIFSTIPYHTLYLQYHVIHGSPVMVHSASPWYTFIHGTHDTFGFSRPDQF